MLQATDITFSYAHGKRSWWGTPAADAHAVVLDRVSLAVERGAVVGLLGPNGSGKTTLIRLLAGLLTPSSGTISLGGRPIGQLSRREVARRLALVPQDTHTTFDYSVLDMVLMGRYAHLPPFALEGVDDIAIAREALAATGTGALEQRVFSTLSGGERQRVVIASALAQATDALLLDEPTASLDIAYQLEISALLRRVNRDRGVTIVLSTHDLNLAASVCDRVVLLNKGQIVADGPTGETLTPDRVAHTYGVHADVQFHPGAGHVTVTPIARYH